MVVIFIADTITKVNAVVALLAGDQLIEFEVLHFTHLLHLPQI